MFNKLRNKFLILNMSIISVLMIVAFLVIYFITYSNVQKENENKLRSLSSAVPSGIDIAIPRRIMTDDAKNNTLTFGTIPYDYTLSFSIQLNKNGEVLNVRSFIDMSDESYLEAAKLVWQAKNDNSTITIDGKQWMYNIAPMSGTMIILRDREKNTVNIEGDDKYNITFLDVTDANKTLTGLLMTFILVGSIMLFIIFIISIYFANRAIKPISVAWDKQKQFIADASHELKTPIAIIAANSDALLANGEETIISQKKWIDYIQAETNRMGKLVNDLLYLAKADDAKIKAVCVPFDLSAIINSIVLSMEAVAFEKGITISQNIEPNIIIESDSEKIEQVVKILLDNAVKYTEEDGHIDVLFKSAKRQIEFTIKNSGKGIPKEHLPNIFDRFYCCDPARTREKGGYGLGLSIAKAIIDSLGGKIYAESVENKSATFGFILTL